LAEYRLHCFAQSGNAYKPALMLTLAGADWEAVQVRFFEGETRDPEWREANNIMGEAPVLEHKGRKLSQSGVILTYLSRQLGLFGPATEDEELEILRWMLFDNHKFTSYFATHRFMVSLMGKPADPAVLGFLRTRAESALGVVEKHLKDKSFLVAERPTIADLSLLGYMYYPTSETGFDLAATHPAIHAWRERVAAMPGWKHPYEILPGAPAAS
jgi:glutathione S-transferase